MFIAALDNAIKYSPDGEQIIISACVVTGSGIISIRDHGCGIPQEDMQNIFMKFYRSRQGCGNGNGSGLGLAIMKSIGERHDIDVSLQSNLHEGRAAIFSLPIDALLKYTPN